MTLALPPFVQRLARAVVVLALASGLPCVAVGANADKASFVPTAIVSVDGMVTADEASTEPGGTVGYRLFVTNTGRSDSQRVFAGDAQLVRVEAVQPAIQLYVAASPPTVSATGGTVTYTYLASNGGNVVLTDVVITDAHCAGVKFVDGDVDGDGALDIDEVWRYTCAATVRATTTTVARATARAGTTVVEATDQTTVPVAEAVPALRVRTTATPSVLPASGTMALNFVVSNLGNVPLSDITLADSECNTIGPVGDANGNSRLDTSEVWSYACSVSLASTTTDTVLATARWGTATVDSSDVTVLVVGKGAAGFPRIGVDTLIVPKSLPAGGGEVTVRYIVRNKGDSPLTEIAVTDTICSQPEYIGGDTNTDGSLQLAETWLYGCRARIEFTTTSTARVSGHWNDASVSALDEITIVVAPVPPTRSPAPPPTAIPEATPTASATTPTSPSPAPVATPGGVPSSSAGPAATSANDIGDAPTIPIAYPTTGVIALAALTGVLAAALLIGMSWRRRNV